MIAAFPLQWPAGYDRTPIKKRSPFKVTSLDVVRKGVLNEIKLMDGINPIISSNIPVRNDGQLYASMRPVGPDHGVAVYFTWNKQQRVLACDTYSKIEDNLRAIEMSIDGLRRLTRYGIADVLNRVFVGFKALPEQAGPSSQSWWQVLDVSEHAPEPVIRAAYRHLAARYHPDNQVTGNREMFDLITNAYNQAPKK